MCNTASKLQTLAWQTKLDLVVNVVHLWFDKDIVAVQSLEMCISTLLEYTVRLFHQPCTIYKLFQAVIESVIIIKNDSW